MEGYYQEFLNIADEKKVVQDEDLISLFSKTEVKSA